MCAEFGWSVDAALVAAAKASNDVELKAIDDKLEDAEENLGDTEVLDALFSKCKYFTRIGDKDGALASYATILTKADMKSEEKGNVKLSTSQRIQIALNKLRLGMFHSDSELVKQELPKAKQLVELGGDWDRRNRLQVYEGVAMMTQRDFKGACELFSKSVATFTCTELMTFEQLVLYTVVTGILSLSRVELQEKVVECAEVRSTAGNIPFLNDLMNGIYECRYKAFFQAIGRLLRACCRQAPLCSNHRRFGMCSQHRQQSDPQPLPLPPHEVYRPGVPRVGVFPVFGVVP
jgi:26S proteasome regulatory subunit N7